MNIVIVSNDNFLKNFLSKEFNNVVFSYDNVRYNDILIIDDVVNTENINLTDIIINLSSIKIKNALNISLPFRIEVLIDTINESIKYLNNNLFEYNNMFLNIYKNNIFINNNIIKLTQKETELIFYLIKNKNSNKNEILKNVWNVNNLENKSLETTIYNIKQKIFDDFIICINSLYSLGVK